MDANVTKYLTQQIMTASPAKLVFMLYERAIGSLHEAIAAIEAGDIEGRWKANTRAVNIISHMWSTLNLDEGGKIAEDLGRLFPFMMTRLAQVDMKNDPAPAREVITLLEPLRDAWHELARHGGAEAPQPAARPAETPAKSPADSATGPDAIPATRTIISA